MCSGDKGVELVGCVMFYKVCGVWENSLAGPTGRLQLVILRSPEPNVVDKHIDGCLKESPH